MAVEVIRQPTRAILPLAPREPLNKSPRPRCFCAPPQPGGRRRAWWFHAQGVQRRCDGAQKQPFGPGLCGRPAALRVLDMNHHARRRAPCWPAAQPPARARGLVQRLPRRFHGTNR
jgi:hypothetical protein